MRYLILKISYDSFSKVIHSHHFFQLDLPMHLTNYLIDNDDDDRKKHTLKFLFGYLKEQKQDEVKLWQEIQVIIEKEFNENQFLV